MQDDKNYITGTGIDEDDNLSVVSDNPLPVEPDEEEAATYPAPEDKRVGVSTDEGTPSDAMDQGDEEVTRTTTGIPD